MYLFEKTEEECSSIKRIERNLDFLFNSFCRSKREFNGFGINIWKIDTEEIKEFINKEEPRILVHAVIFEQKILSIVFEFENAVFERSYV